MRTLPLRNLQHSRPCRSVVLGSCPPLIQNRSIHIPLNHDLSWIGWKIPQDAPFGLDTDGQEGVTSITWVRGNVRESNRVRTSARSRSISGVFAGFSAMVSSWAARVPGSCCLASSNRTLAPVASGTLRAGPAPPLLAQVGPSCACLWLVDPVAATIPREGG